MASESNILVVDDDDIILLAIKETLKPLGYHVDGFLEPTEARRSVDQKNYAIVISDQRMNALSGIEFLEYCKQKQPEAVRILITGVHSVEILTRAINECEVFRFVSKPWVRDEFTKIVASAWERHCFLMKCKEIYQTQAQEISDLKQKLHDQPSSP